VPVKRAMLAFEAARDASASEKEADFPAVAGEAEGTGRQTA
jgi:hypothetical protein